jgi:membrane-bound ClpP family serine protease
MRTNSSTSFVKVFACFALLLAMSAALARADVRIQMKDGSIWKGDVGAAVDAVFNMRGVNTTITGRLTKITDLYIEVDGKIAGIDRRQIIMRSDLVALKTSADAKAAEPVAARNPELAAPDAGRAGKGAIKSSSGPGVFFMPMEGTVGFEFRHEEIEKLAAEADKYGPHQILVLRINSPGGLVIEGEDIHRTISEVRKRHRVVAWIEEAISGGCAAAICCDEIYFMTEGTAGSVTMFSGTTAATGAQLQAWLKTLGDWMEEGGRSRYIAEAMINAPKLLSYDKDPVTGAVTFYNTLQGKYVLSDAKENLTFNATNAVHCGFAQGIADTTDELAKLLDLPKWNELGDGVGRKISEDWLRTAKQAQDDIPKIINRINTAGIGRDQAETIGRLISLYQDLIQWRKKAERIAEMMFGVPDIETLEFNIEELRRQLARLRGR